MNKIAIITDSNSGITVEEAKKLGVGLVPMPISIDDVNYLEGVDLQADTFFDKQKGGANILTSMPSLEYLMNIWEDALKDHDAVVYIPMASALSSSYETAKMLSEEYDGKVLVVDAKRISVTQKHAVKDALKMVKKGCTAQEIYDYLEKDALNASIYLCVDTLHYLRKGGRISTVTALAGTVLNLKPVLKIEGGVIDAYGKARGMKKAVQIMIDAIKKDIETKFKGKKYLVQMAYSGSREIAEGWREIVKKHFPEEELHMEPLAFSICTHTGENAIGIGLIHILE